ncbi:MAG: tetratricopeptide repeat protein [Oleispira sp.]|nr:tetratricopeptide repeat protein [Oleispira sp.]
MNTKIYKQVHTLAKDLLKASEGEDQERFDKYYAQLKKVCNEYEGSTKDHPVQWETLADFTEDLELAVTIYDKALAKAEAISSADFCSSIGYSIATMKIELDDRKGAIASLEKAKGASSGKIEDKNLKAEIHDLLIELKSV